jgi:hypothetical protein
VCQSKSGRPSADGAELTPSPSQANLNARLNILFLLDALVSSSGAPTTSSAQGGYLDLAARDLRDIMALVVPDTRDGVQLNASSALRVSAGGRKTQQGV